MDLKEIIKNHGFTLKQFAEKMGISQPALSQIINKGEPSLSSLRRMAEILNVSVASLIDEGTTVVSNTQQAIICPHCHKPIIIEVKSEPIPE